MYWVISSVYEFDGVPTHGRELIFRYPLSRFEQDVRSHTHLRAENILDLLDEHLAAIGTMHPNLNLIGSERISKNLNDVIFHIWDIVQNIEKCRRIERRTLEFDHLPLAAQQ